LNYYKHDNNDEEKTLLQQFAAHTQLDNNFSHPYIASASGAIIKHFVEGFNHGITVTCPGFYGPQGRVLRTGTYQPTAS
jgi:uridine phosphorylase